MRNKSSFLAGRYARAYDSCAKDTAEAEGNFEDYKNALSSLADAAEYINNPVVTLGVKAELLDKILSKNRAADFIRLLITQKRFGLAGEVSRELGKLLDARKGIKRVSVKTAGPAESHPGLEEALAQYFNGKISARYEQDAALLAGIIVRQGDVLIDSSAAGRVKQLEKILTGK